MTKNSGREELLESLIILFGPELLYSDQILRPVRKTVSTLFAAGGSWDKAFGTDYAVDWDWKEQLRLMVLHIDWLLANGWALPEGVDIGYMAEKAFED